MSPVESINFHHLKRGKKYHAICGNNPEDDVIVSFQHILEEESGLFDHDGFEMNELHWVFLLEEPTDDISVCSEERPKWIIPMDALENEEILFYPF